MVDKKSRHHTEGHDENKQDCADISLRGECHLEAELRDLRLRRAVYIIAGDKIEHPRAYDFHTQNNAVHKHDGMHSQKEQKVTQIIKPDASADPPAVVIEASDAAVAQRTVLRAGQLRQTAGRAAAAGEEEGVVIREEGGQGQEGARGDGARVGEEDGQPGREGQHGVHVDGGRGRAQRERKKRGGVAVEPGPGAGGHGAVDDVELVEPVREAELGHGEAGDEKDDVRGGHEILLEDASGRGG